MSLPLVILPSHLGLYKTLTASLLKGKTTPNKYPWHDTKQSDGEVPVMLELCGMWSTPTLPSLPGPLWLGVVAPDRVLSMSQTELNCVLKLNWIVWNRTIYMHKMDLAIITYNGWCAIKPNQNHRLFSFSTSIPQQFSSLVFIKLSFIKY